ncbi:MAG: flotillin family protein [Gammaproteobacteria bacterium]|nr:flotillin family protein [Gammaproteobacteria bacterium]
MELTKILFIAGIAGLILISLLVIGTIVARLYRRASKEVAFVRTGAGGQKVVMNGGAIVIPLFQETISVNMNTLRLEVRRANEQALITRDRMRVDVQAEFYVRVQPTEESIANAAQTLGQRTMHPEDLKELVEGKFVDALRAVAAEMTMTELHEQRVNFVQKVQQAVSEDLLKNGLELESVSLTGLDQTSREHFNPDNAFDAEGLTKLTEEIEARRKRRNDIEQLNEVQIRKVNLDAERQRLELARDEEYARLEQEREIAVRKAAQTTEIANERWAKQREAQMAEIAAKQQVEQARITAERIVAEERIETEQQLKNRQIVKAKAIESAEIEKAKTIETVELDKRKALELAEQDRAIAVAERSKAQSEAEAQAAAARSQAVKAAEQVVTVQEVERAERAKQIELLEAAKQADREAITITTAADADKRAAEDRAAAVRILAEADADKRRISAQADADADVLTADAAAKRYAVEATGKRALHEAENLLSSQQIAMQIKMAIIRHMPEIIRESVKPLERIESIKIVQIDGLPGGGSRETDNPPGNLADQVVNSALRYRAQAPLLEALLKEVGISAGDIHGLMAGASELTGESPPSDKNAKRD